MVVTIGKRERQDFLRKNDDLDEEALGGPGGGAAAKTLVENTVVGSRDDNRSKWANTTVSTKTIKALSREFASNKRYKPSGYTTEAYDRNEPKNRKETVTVHHFAYLVWPDHTAPADPAPMVGCYKLCRQLAAGQPITVHCSAGIGRSATFVGEFQKKTAFGRPTRTNGILFEISAIDYAWQKIRENSDTHMISVLKDLRGQRFQAIQSPIQYIFLHMCILELAAEENLLSRKGKYGPFLGSYVDMLKKYNKKVAAAEARAEAAAAANG
ncbi:Protein-tyrosine phosphatase [Necator americanus]|uniref:Protein-tyrosine phosphatase n=1 Tax=Necator americanus TaxID=51031 RepID=W2SLD1_NECAM|nr:Protein-tyrosine phosphatase [Necator americanus]ETN69676.1 Protein-tyrosine phosphatase [Necator americanus]